MRDLEVEHPLKGVVARSKELLAATSNDALFRDAEKTQSPQSADLVDSSEASIQNDDQPESGSTTANKRNSEIITSHGRSASYRMSDQNLFKQGSRLSYASSHITSEDSDLQPLQDSIAKLSVITNNLFDNANSTLRKLKISASGLNNPIARNTSVSPETFRESLAQMTSAVQLLIEDAQVFSQKFNGLVEANSALIQQVASENFENTIEEQGEDSLAPLKTLGKVQETGRSESSYSIANLAEDNSSVSSTPVVAKSKSMFPRLPQEIVDSGISKAECMRLSVVYELIDTESDFVRDLSLMVTYHKPEIENTGLCSTEEIDTLFSNADQLIKVNQQLLDKLVEKKAADAFMPEVCDALVDVADSFKIYTSYCGNYPEAMKLVHKLQGQPEFKTHLDRLMNSTEGRGLSVESFLIKPVQRICKYPLLLRELQKYTDKNSKDTIPLRLATEKIESVVSLVNEATRQLGERDRIASVANKIEAPAPVSFEVKRFVRDGNVVRILNGRSKDRYIILFTDLVFVCKGIQKNGKYPLETCYETADLCIKNEKADPNAKAATRNIIQVYINNFKETLVLSFPTEDEKNKWSDAFSSAIDIAMKESHKRSSSDMKRSSLALHRQSSEIIHEGSESGGLAGGLRALNRSLTTRRKKQNSQDSFQSVTSGSMKWKTLNPRKKSEFESSAALDRSSNDLGSVEQLRDEPELVEVNGQIWKRTNSAMGVSYYYNPQTKETSWSLPDDFIVLDPETGSRLNVKDDEAKPEQDNQDNAASPTDDNDDEYEGTPVEGRPDLRKMDAEDGTFYYYNINTRETSWDLPA